jgi:hypothetical protein
MGAENSKKWTLQLDSKPDFELCMQRIYAWYEGKIIDRPPVRFSAHNANYNEEEKCRSWNHIRDKWFDVEFQVENFIQSLQGRKFLGESFPVYWPNLGPNFYAALYGSKLEYREVTSWAEPCIHHWDDLKRLQLELHNEYFQTIEKLTRYALERCKDRFMVGYTDLHPGMDCVAAWRDTQSLLLDLYDDPEEVKKALKIASADFHKVYDYFDEMLKQENQLSVTWMEIPSFGKMHIPSCDFAAMISTSQFIEFCLPFLQEEVKPMTHNIFHMDGKGVARHLDVILEIPEIQAIQWVQGVNEDKPIMQWIPLIQKIQAAGKSVVVDLEMTELEDFIGATKPEGLLLCIPSNNDKEKEAILKRVAKW